MVSLDPTSGATVHSQEHKFLVTWLDDAAYMGLMVYVYYQTGINKIFIPLAPIFATNPVIVQCIRYGLMFASMLEIRRFLEMAGIKTELINFYLHELSHRLL